MYFRLKFKKFVNHWYPEIPHDSLSDISLCPRMERILEHIDQYKNGEVEIALIEEFGVISEYNILQFDEKDITRWFTSNDDFDMNIYIDNHQFIISSDLYSLLEIQYHFNFHENIYRIEIV